MTLDSAPTLSESILRGLIVDGCLQKVEEFALMSAPLLNLSCLQLIVQELPEVQVRWANDV